jgi:hypothetical protein
MNGDNPAVIVFLDESFPRTQNYTKPFDQFSQQREVDVTPSVRKKKFMQILKSSMGDVITRMTCLRTGRELGQPPL